MLRARSHIVFSGPSGHPIDSQIIIVVAAKVIAPPITQQIKRSPPGAIARSMAITAAAIKALAKAGRQYAEKKSRGSNSISYAKIEKTMGRQIIAVTKRVTTIPIRLWK